MAKILTFTQQKGGAGKTSLAIHLASYWASKGKSVALVDGDPQGSLMAWSSMRAGDDGAPSLTVEQAEGWKAATVVGNLARSHDYVLIDTAPHAETASRTAAREADLVVVPMQPSPLDLWATDGSMEMITAEKKPSVLVLNRVPPRSKLADEVTAAAKKKGLSVAKSRLGNRQAFAASFMAGKGIMEASPRSKAGEEITALAQELGRKLSKL
ncbi:MAG: ParA family partition ATPase [Pseudomonadota bacterium]